MSKILYGSKTFSNAGLGVIAEAERICNEYARQGYRLTLRQLYYRFIATDAFPDNRRFSLAGSRWVKDPHGTKNAEPNYDWLGKLVSDARVGGRIDWNHLEDRTREFNRGDGGWSGPDSAIRSVVNWYGIPHWEGQPEYLEVWVEKEALVDVVSRPAGRWDVGYFACKGYVSQSAMHEAAIRLRGIEADDRKVTIIHLGDHDPSGIDMTRDIQDRLNMFRSDATVKRIALNMDQIAVMNPPPSPAKIADSRYQDYVDQFGEDSWELDAIEPADLERLIEDEILTHLDQELYDERVAQEERERVVIQAISDNYQGIVQYLRDEGHLAEEDSEDEE